MTNEQIKELLVDFYSKIDENTCSIFDLNMRNSILDVNGNLKTWISEKTLGLALYSVFNAVKKTREDEEKRLRVEKLNALHSTDEYFGEVGYKFKGHPMKVTLTRMASYETQFGTTYVWNMIDEEGHTIVWKTSTTPYYEVLQSQRILENDFRDYCEKTYNEHRMRIVIDEHEEDDMNVSEFNREHERLSNLMNSIEKNIPITFNIISGSVKEHKEYTNREGVITKQTLITRCKIDDIKGV